MKQKMLIIFGLIFMLALMVGINAVSYNQQDKESDKEIAPNRSTYNAGATGTRALYDLLNETGRKVTRWQESPAALLYAKNSPATFVIIGDVRIDIGKQDSEQLLRWVSQGGRLVLIDRYPSPSLLKTTANWTVKHVPSNTYPFDVNPILPADMIGSVGAFKPNLPSVFTRNVTAVQPSKFAASADLTFGVSEQKVVVDSSNSPAIFEERDEPLPEPLPVSTPSPKITPIFNLPPPPKPTPMPVIETKPEKIETVTFAAPFVHLTTATTNLLVDMPYGAGNIVYLSDPYIVSNGGIGLVDNAQLAINILSSREGLIAFDEYHQGYGAKTNSIISYFTGTPVVAIFGQIFLLIAVLFWSQSRRFARPLPAAEPDRLSKLEYVSAMAELQRRTKAYDLAVENIYSEFRRSATKSLGIDNFTVSLKDLAKTIAERTNEYELDIFNTMHQCEEIIRGEKTNKFEVLRLTGRLREIEEKLGIKRTRKQAFHSRRH